MTREELREAAFLDKLLGFLDTSKKSAYLDGALSLKKSVVGSPEIVLPASIGEIVEQSLTEFAFKRLEELGVKDDD